MANLPRRFLWLGPVGDHGTHLTLEPGKSYSSAAVSGPILLTWHSAGLIRFEPDDPNEPSPPDMVLDVQKGTISTKDILDRMRTKLRFIIGE